MNHQKIKIKVLTNKEKKKKVVEGSGEHDSVEWGKRVNRCKVVIWICFAVSERQIKSIVICQN